MGNEQQSNRSNRPNPYSTNNRFPSANIQRQPREYERPIVGRPTNPYDSYYQNNPSSSTQNTNNSLTNPQNPPQNSFYNYQSQSRQKIVNQLEPTNPYDSYYQNPSSTQNMNQNSQNMNKNLINQQNPPQNSLNQSQPKVVNQLDKPKENAEMVIFDIDRVKKNSLMARPEKKKEVFRGNLVEYIFLFFSNRIFYVFSWITRNLLWNRKKKN